MHRTRLSAGVAAALTALLTLGAEGATLDSELVAKVAGLGPGQQVDVIIRCADPVRPGTFANLDRRTRRTELIRALRARSGLCRSLAMRELAGGNGTDLRELWTINAVAAKIRVDALERLAKRQGIDSIGLNREVKLPVEPQLAVPMGVPDETSLTFWNLSEVRIPDLWALGYYGQGMVVATLDTGVDLNHLDLAPNWRGGSNSWFDPHNEHPLPYDADGHGTGVMGLMIGGDSTGVYIGAAPGAQWIAAKIFNDAGTSDYAKIHQSFQWVLDPDQDAATDDAPDIVNNSWALTKTDVCFGEFAADIALLRAADIAVVFSAGNFGPNDYTSVEPANDPGSLSVGAVDYYRTVLTTSSRGPSACDGYYYPGLVAPGNSVYTAALTSSGAFPQSVQYGTGTSFASPHVAGVMTILKSAAPDATVDELESAVVGGALDLGVAGLDNASGAGYLDAVESYYLLVAAPGNNPPIATDDAYGTPQNAPLTVVAPGVLSNDTDVESDALTASLTTGPANGTLALETDGSFSYTPNAGFLGADSFTYVANDALAASNVATVTIAVTQADTKHVGDLDIRAQTGRNVWRTIVTVTVHDNNDRRLEGVVVDGSWAPTATGTCTTDAVGHCSITGPFLSRATVASTAFTVTSLTGAGGAYASVDNHDPDGDSDGTSISIARP